MIKVLLLLCGIIAFVSITTILLRRKTKPRRKKSRHLFWAIIVVLIIISSCFVVSRYMPDLIDGPLSNLPIFKGSSKTIDVCLVEDHMDTISKINEDTWSTLSLEEKLSIINVFKDMEVTYLNISHPISIECGTLPEKVIANYSDSKHVITFDTEHLLSMNAEDVIDSVCHEVRHALQHRLADLYDSLSEEEQKYYIFDSIKEYSYNFSHYIKGSTGDKDKYLDQAIEVDAREYAKERVTYYIQLMESTINHYGAN